MTEEERQKLSERERRVMAPWPALMLLAVAAAAVLVAFAWVGKEMPTHLGWMLMALCILPAFGVSGGDVSDIGAWIKDRISK